MQTIEDIQSELRNRGIPGWLFYDHHHRDAIAYHVLGLPESLMVSRRWFYLVPADGDPIKLVHRIEPHHLDALPGKKIKYAAWLELVSQLRTMLSGLPSVAMQFSPENMIFTISTADAGMVDLIRSFGVKVVSSADLVARFEATWSAKQIETHFAAARGIDEIMAEVFPEIGRRVRKGGTTEFEIQQWLVEAFRRQGLIADAAPIVAVNQNSSDPHYMPTADRCTPIRTGDFVLLDVWGKLDEPNSVYYDISWTGCIGDSVPERVREIFDIVRRSRDAGIEKVTATIAARKKLAG